MEEWEYHFALAGVAHHSVKAMLAKNIDGPSRDVTREMGGEGTKQQEQVSLPEPGRPCIVALAPSPYSAAVSVIDMFPLLAACTVLEYII